MTPPPNEPHKTGDPDPESALGRVVHETAHRSLAVLTRQIPGARTRKIPGVSGCKSQARDYNLSVPPETQYIPKLA